MENKKPLYKKWWVWVIGVIVFFSVIGSLGKSEPQETMIEQEAAYSTTESAQLTRSEQAFCNAFEQYLAIVNHGADYEIEDSVVLAGLDFFVEKGVGTSFEALTKKAQNQGKNNDTAGFVDSIKQIGVRCGLLNAE